MSQANIDLIQSMYDAFARGDGPSALAALDPAIVWNEAENFPYADRNPYIGPLAVAEGIFGRVATEWDGFRVNVAEILDAGDTVVALGRYTGKYKASGATLDAQFAHVWRVQNGKVIGLQQYADTAQATRVVTG
jgi:hypothetical protein